jgi:hypothetical protein
MSKKNKILQWRNKEIYAEYIAHLRNGLSVMMAYATVAHRYDLSEESIRKIVAQQANR